MIRTSFAAARLLWESGHREFTLAILLIIVNAVSIPALAAAQGWFVTMASSQGALLLAVVTALALGAVFRIMVNRVEGSLRDDLARSLSHHLLERVLAATSLRSGGLQEYGGNATDVALVRRNIDMISESGWVALRMLSTVCSLGLSVGLLASISWPLAATVPVALAPAALAAVASRLQGKRLFAGNKSLFREEAMHRLMLKSDSSQEVRLLRAGDLIEQKASEHWSEAARQLAFTRGVVAGALVVGSALFAATTVAVAVSASASLAGGAFVVALSLLTQLSAQVGELASSARSIGEGGLIMRKYQRLLTHDETTKSDLGSTSEVPARTDFALRFRDVTLKLREGAQPLVVGTRTFPPGQIVGLVGANGSGKSSFVKLALGVLNPSEGLIELGSGAANRFSAAFQDYTRPPLQLGEAVNLGDAEMGKSSETLGTYLKRAGGLNPLDRGRIRWSSALGDAPSGVGLSGGEWQKIAIARAFGREGVAILAFDEPASALDPQSEEDLYRGMSLREGYGELTLLFVVSHRMRAITFADRILVFDKGVIVQDGSPNKLASEDGLFRRMQQVQQRGY